MYQSRKHDKLQTAYSLDKIHMARISALTTHMDLDIDNTNGSQFSQHTWISSTTTQMDVSFHKRHGSRVRQHKWMLASTRYTDLGFHKIRNSVFTRYTLPGEDSLSSIATSGYRNRRQSRKLHLRLLGIEAKNSLCLFRTSKNKTAGCVHTGK